MVKGISRRVVVVDAPEHRFFEQAIFTYEGDATGYFLSGFQISRHIILIEKSNPLLAGNDKRSRSGNVVNSTFNLATHLDSMSRFCNFYHIFCHATHGNSQTA